MISVKASAKNVRMSPRKVGVVAALVRGQSVTSAITILEHTPRRSAMPVKKVIQSARANAENNHGLKPDSLNLTQISVTPGPRIKRFKPAARGMAAPYQLKSSHIFVEITGEKREPKKPAKANSESKSDAKPKAKKGDT
jgi:large subunit ribosomal protein L22